jgi:hypothetical protein
MKDDVHQIMFTTSKLKDKTIEEWILWHKYLINYNVSIFKNVCLFVVYTPKNSADILNLTTWLR